MDKSKVRKLYQAQQILDAKEAVYKDLLGEWEMNHADLLTEIEDIAAGISKLEEEIRADRVKEWEKDKENKSKVYGIGIQERIQLDYPEEKAFSWALDHKLALKLDKRKFESIAKPTGSEESDIDFVLVRKVAIATIAGDLGKYLDD